MKEGSDDEEDDQPPALNKLPEAYTNEEKQRNYEKLQEVRRQREMAAQEKAEEDAKLAERKKK